jgi:hypothetical protein
VLVAAVALESTGKLDGDFLNVIAGDSIDIGGIH